MLSATERKPAPPTDAALMAHLLRRAGFGATRDQLDRYLKDGYEATVEALLNPPHSEPADQDLVDRYFIATVEARSPSHAVPHWAWRLATSEHPLEEKIALFWHGLLAVGGIKLDHGLEMLREIDLFRRHGLGPFRTLLSEISRDPGMMYWLDNQNSHKTAPNENYGRELLELFSMGIDRTGAGAYTEADVKAAARAFTGWAAKPTMPPFFLGPFDMEFIFDPADHDDGEKTFLGRTGNFNGDDIIDIIVEQDATARFVARRLYLFFVSDTPDEAEVERLAGVFRSSGGEIRAILRAIFLSDHFKSEALRFRKVKSPAELVWGVVRTVDRYRIPELDVCDLPAYSTYMGQMLLNPPSVEGWHEGEEWVDSGALIERVNFAVNELGRTDSPGVRRMIDSVKTSGRRLSPTALVDRCLDAMGALAVSERTRAILIDHAGRNGSLDTTSEEADDRVVELLQAIVATPDFQYC